MQIIPFFTATNRLLKLQCAAQDNVLMLHNCQMLPKFMSCLLNAEAEVEVYSVVYGRLKLCIGQ